MQDRIQILKKHPEIGKSTNLDSTRILILKHYSILYQIRLPEIIITGFWDNRKDPKELIKFLRKK